MTHISLSLTRAVEVPFVPKNPSTWADGMRVGIRKRGGGGGGLGGGGGGGAELSFAVWSSGLLSTVCL